MTDHEMNTALLNALLVRALVVQTMYKMLDAEFAANEKSYMEPTTGTIALFTFFLDNICAPEASTTVAAEVVRRFQDVPVVASVQLQQVVVTSQIAMLLAITPLVGHGGSVDVVSFITQVYGIARAMNIAVCDPDTLRIDVLGADIAMLNERARG